MSRYEDLKALVDGLEEDFDKFYNNGNKAAGTRAFGERKCQDLKNFAQDVRAEVTKIKNEG